MTLQPKPGRKSITHRWRGRARLIDDGGYPLRAFQPTTNLQKADTIGSNASAGQNSWTTKLGGAGRLSSIRLQEKERQPMANAMVRAFELMILAQAPTMSTCMPSSTVYQVLHLFNSTSNHLAKPLTHQSARQHGQQISRSSKYRVLRHLSRSRSSINRTTRDGAPNS